MMFKYFVAAAVALVSTPASAQTYQISNERLTTMQKLADSVCRDAMDGKGHAGKEFDRIVAPLLLTDSEYMILISMCIAYAQGRIDGARSR